MSPELLAEQFDIPVDVKTSPVSKWNPPLSGDMDLIIRANGQWIHEGGEIKRPELVRLFASVLKCEANEYFLVSPVEKWRIQVEDLPLHVTSVDKEGSLLQCSLLSGGVVSIGCNNPLEFDHGDDSPKLSIRDNLFARFNRNAFYQLTELGEWNDNDLELRSGDYQYCLPIDA